MEILAKHRHAKISAQKVRLAANQVRGLPVSSAVDILNFSPKKSAAHINAVLHSAVANAEHNNGLDVDDLYVSKVFIDEGPTAKRFRARAKGRGDRILKRTCHITVILDEKK